MNNMNMTNTPASVQSGLPSEDLNISVSVSKTDSSGKVKTFSVTTDEYEDAIRMLKYAGIINPEEHVMIDDGCDCGCGTDPCSCGSNTEMDDDTINVQIDDQGMLSMVEGENKKESFIKKNKKEFKKRYGDRWEQVLYATANKMFESEEIEEDCGVGFANSLGKGNNGKDTEFAKVTDTGDVGELDAVCDHLHDDITDADFEAYWNEFTKIKESLTKK